MCDAATLAAFLSHFASSRNSYTPTHPMTLAVVGSALKIAATAAAMGESLGGEFHRRCIDAALAELTEAVAKIKKLPVDHD